MGHLNPLGEHLYQLARLGMTGRPQDVQAYVRRLLRPLREQDEQVAERLVRLLADSPSPSAPTRGQSASIDLLPVDADSRLSLIRVELPTPLNAPVLDESVRSALDSVIAERERLAELTRAGLAPTRSLLFTGPPGVGKTMSARWLASRLDRPLLLLDLSAVMSSFLGKTGANIRAVIDHAKAVPSVLLLDEFDAIAKRRDDDAEIGELKRLVTVLLQEIDDWPANSLLISATNHGELLDPAVWRRFDQVITFPLPSEVQRRRIVLDALGSDAEALAGWEQPLAAVWAGRSFSDIVRDIHSARRRAIVTDGIVLEELLDLIKRQAQALDSKSRIEISNQLQSMGLSDHKVNRITGVHRKTLRSRRVRGNSDEGAAT